MNQCAPDSSKRRPCSSEFDIDGSHVFRDVDFESLQEEGAFVPESVIHALPAYLHCTHQLVGRRGGKAFLREGGYGTMKSSLQIKFLRSGHLSPFSLMPCTPHPFSACPLQ